MYIITAIECMGIDQFRSGPPGFPVVKIRGCFLRPSHPSLIKGHVSLIPSSSFGSWVDWTLCEMVVSVSLDSGVIRLLRDSKRANIYIIDTLS